MLYTIPQLYQRLIQKPLEVYEVFRNFFGEDYVDLQYSHTETDVCEYIKEYLSNSSLSPSEKGEYEVSESLLNRLIDNTSESFSLQCYIYVWWSSVTVTNEFDKSIDIQDLYAKISLTLEGRIPYESAGFLLNRATYTKEQFYSNYLHSHIQSIPKDDFTHFMNPCLGHGPIQNTIATLRNECNDVSWMLFCQELSMYVTVESIKGGPWKRLESVGTLLRSHTYLQFHYTDFSSVPVSFPSSVIHHFIKYYLEHGHLSFDFIDGKYVCGMTYFDFIIDISNAFISFYNELPADDVPCSVSRLFSSFILYNYVVSNGMFYTMSDCCTESNLNAYQDKLVLTFKGKEIRTHIIDSSRNDFSEVTVLSHSLSMYILHSILKIVNYQYKNDHNNKLFDHSKPFDSFNFSGSSSQTRQRVCFI